MQLTKPLPSLSTVLPFDSNKILWLLLVTKSNTELQLGINDKYFIANYIQTIKIPAKNPQEEHQKQPGVFMEEKGGSDAK